MNFLGTCSKERCRYKHEMIPTEIKRDFAQQKKLSKQVLISIVVWSISEHR